MKKLITLLFIMAVCILGVQAKTVKRDFSSVIKESGVDKESIAVSIKEAGSGNSVYIHNDKILFHPASVQKIITIPVAAEVLGNDYKFSTELYKRTSDSYVLKLGADPFLSSKDLKTLTNNVKEDTKHIYIDDSILDNKTWGEGWQWDDDMNILMPRFSSYNLDKNLVKITIMPSQGGGNAQIVNPTKYPFIFINNVQYGKDTDIKISRDNSVSANTLKLEGTVSRPTTLTIPINNLQRYFEIRLTQNLENHKVYLKERFTESKVKSSDTKIAEVEHDLSLALDEIFKNSNNMVAETVFKLSGQGTDIGGIRMFNDYCTKHKIDNSRIRIVDGSGVSKNNLMSADFITNFLVLNRKNPIMDKLPHPGEGTLTHRMLPIKDNLRAKTGTLSDISSIAGYLKAKSGKEYVFCIMINDMKLSESDKKMLEDYIIREAYIRL